MSKWSWQMILCIHLVCAAMPGRWLGETDRLSDAMRPIRRGVKIIIPTLLASGDDCRYQHQHVCLRHHFYSFIYLFHSHEKVPRFQHRPQLIIWQRSKNDPPWFIFGIGIRGWCRSSAYLLLHLQQWRSQPLDSSSVTSPDVIFHPSKRSQR